MSHQHESCTVYNCDAGMILGPCSEDCPVDDCTVVSHCPCLCHSGKTCLCGHTWPRMPAQPKGSN